MLRQPVVPGSHIAAQTVIEAGQRRLPQILRHTAVKSLGYAPGDGGLRVAVAAQPDGIAYGLLEGTAFQKGDDGFGDGLLTALFVTVRGPDLGQAAGQIIP